MGWRNFWGKANLEKKLLSSVMDGDIDKVKELLKMGADIEVRDKDNYTPLIIACLNGDHEIVNILIENGCDINSQTEYGVAPIICAAEGGHFNIVKQLLEHGADISIQTTNDLTPLIQAATYGHEEIVQLLLEHGADPNVSRSDFMTPLMVAAKNGHKKIVDILIEKKADVNATNENQETALFWADNLSIIHSLTEAGASTKILTIDGHTPLFLASKKGNEELVQFWLNQGVDINSIEKTEGITALTQAIIGEEEDDKDRDFEARERIVQKLLENNADPNLVENNYYPIHFAAECGYYVIISLLLEYGAKINVRTPPREAEKFLGYTPLILAASFGHERVVKLLVEKGADINLGYIEGGGGDAVFCAEDANHSEIAKYLRKASRKKMME